MQVKKFSVKKLTINLAITLVVAGLAFYYLTKSDIVTLESLKQVSVGGFFAVFGYFLLAVLIVSLCDYLVYRTCSKKMNYYRCVVNHLLGNLGSNITPFRSGHYPLKAYYQLGEGVTVDEIATGLVKCQVIYSITSIFVYLVMTITFGVLGTRIEFYGTTVSIWLVILVGFSFHTLVFGVIVLLSFCKPLQNKVAKWSASIYCKIKKKAEKQEIYENITLKFEAYRTQILAVFKDFKRSIAPILVYMVYMPIQGTAQYIAYLLISGGHFSVEELLVFYTLNITVTYITNVIPLPGGIGTAEVLFNMVFVSVIASGMLGGTLLLWRLSTFYGVILFELLVFAISLILRGRFNRKTGVENSENLEKTPENK